MTTIAFKDGIMASDSCIAGGGIRSASVSKVLRTSAGALVGWAGEADIRAVLALIDKIKSPDKLPTKQEIAACQTDFELIIAFSPFSVYTISANEEDGGRYSGYVNFTNLGIAACGSGAELALGAMSAGKSAREAVAIACKFDCRSRLPVHSVGFEPRSKPKPKPKPK